MIIKVKCDFLIGQLQFATRNLQDESGNWENRVVNISSLSRNIGEDKSYEISGITIDFNDNDRYFREMMSGGNRYIAGKKVELYDENDNLIYTGNVEKWSFEEDLFTLDINDRLSGLDTVVPLTLTKEEYPNAVDEADGTSIPIIYGHVTSEAGAVKCWKVATGKYLVASHRCFSREAVFDKDGSDVTAYFDAITYEGSGLDERAYILYNQGGDFAEDYVYVNVKGKMQDSVLIEHPLDALDDLVTTYTGMQLSSINYDANKTIISGRSYQISAVIDNQAIVKDVLKDFSFSFDCDFYLSKDNQIVISMLDWDTLDSRKNLDSKQLTSFQVQELPEEIRNKIKYQYMYNYALGKYQRIPIFEKQTSISNWGEFYNKNESLDLKYVSDYTTAFDVVQRYAYQKSNPLRNAVVDLPLEEFLGLDISDIVEIQHPGAIDDRPRKYQIRRVDIDFLSDSVQMECLDITSLGGGIFILGDDSFTGNWHDNPSDYERQFAYLCDSNGQLPGGAEGKILY